MFQFSYTSLIRVLLIAIVYYAAARLGLLMALGKTNASPVWPPSGLTFALVLLFGTRIWPGIFIGAFFANLTTFLANNQGTYPLLLIISGFIATGNTLEALAGNFLLSKFRSREFLSRTRDFFVFILTTLMMCIVSSTVGATTLYVAGIIDPGLYNTVLFTWWTGDATGILVLTPAILALSGTDKMRWKTRQMIEFLILFSLLIFFVQALFGTNHMTGLEKINIYLLFIFFSWAALRTNQQQWALLILLVSVLAILNTLQGNGPFIERTQNESLISLQIFLGTASATMMLLHISLLERKRLEAILKEANDTLEKRVSERTLILEKQKEELRRFLHIVSHDLQEPLRTIASFLQLLEGKVKDKLQKEELEYIHFAFRAAGRMKALIMDLLSYSKLDTDSGKMEAIDIRSVLEELKLDLKQLLDENTVRITIQDKLPALFARRTDVILLFQNLITNAVKYRSQNPPEIVISAEYIPEGWKFCIEDNGIGIEKQYYKKIFEIFQRLHGKDKYEGTGMGLALCRKIAEKYNGKIWVESQAGKGSRFYFILKSAGS